jgi:hypothetical protein
MCGALISADIERMQFSTDRMSECRIQIVLTGISVYRSISDTKRSSEAKKLSFHKYSIYKLDHTCFSLGDLNFLQFATANIY